MRAEIQKHWTKLLKISKLSDQQLEESYYSILTNITFINEEIIPSSTWEKSEILTSGIDLDDTDFVALTIHLKGKLWTGDNVLRDGLKRKAFKNVLTTKEILKLWAKKKEI